MNMDRFSEHRDTHLDRNVAEEIEREQEKGDDQLRLSRDMSVAEQNMAVFDHLLKAIHQKP